MKTTKRLLSLLLAVMMVLALVITSALAADDGSVVINNVTAEKEYKLYKVFDVTVTEGKTVYTYTANDSTDSFLTAMKGTGSPFTLVETTTEGTYNVTTTADAGTISEWLKAQIEATGSSWTATKSATANQDATNADYDADAATLTFSGLAYGFYYINTTAGTAVTIDSVTGSTPVSVQDKNTTPSKPVDPDDPDDQGAYKVIVDEDGTPIMTGSTVSYGDTVYYLLQINATNYNGTKQITEYVAHDVLGAGLKDLKVTGVEVIDNTLADTDTNKVKTLATSAYTVSAATVDSTTGKSTTTITIPWVAPSGEDNSYVYGDTPLYSSNSTIKIYVQATVDTDATIGAGTPENPSNLTNQGWFSWNMLDPNNGPSTEPTDPNNPGDSDTTTVTSTTYAIAINKVDSEKNPLAGAQFEIYLGNDKVSVKATDVAGVYEYDASATNYTVESPVNGIIVVKGVAAGTYTLKEIKAPDGYNLLTSDVTVEASKFSDTATTTTIYTDANGDVVKEEVSDGETVTYPTVATEVVNNAGTELPSTGGIGTQIFYVFGGILVVAAGILLITKRRMKGEE